ncbi:MAG: FMN-dependent NADH-azoreductase [Kiloniellaceae bacterium]
MSDILVITSSASGEASVSNQLVVGAVDALRRKDPAARIVSRDLGAAPLPHLTAETLAAFFGEPATKAQIAARALSDTIVAEVQAADTLVIGAPMYNFGIPSTLKAWFDHLLRAGVTFRYTEAGPVGLLQGKRAIVVLTRGGLYSEGPAQAMDAQEPHLRTLLGFIGIDDVTFVRSERLAMGPELRAEAIDAARGHLDRAIEDRLHGTA